jgi:hypothetical protein
LGNLIGQVKVISDTEWLGLSTKIEIYSEKEELLASVEDEGGGKCFVFRDAKNNKPLALALWKWLPIGRNFFGLPYTYIQDWTVFIVDRPKLEKQKIPMLFLVWALLKHTQKNLEGPRDLPYVTSYGPLLPETDFSPHHTIEESI